MKIYLLTVLSILVFANMANADIAIECEMGPNKTVTLDGTDVYYLKDSTEPGLKTSKVIAAADETNDSVEFLFDFGSDYEKRAYIFTGLRNCGLYDSEAKVVTLTKSLKSFNGQTRLPQVVQCSCVED